MRIQVFQQAAFEGPGAVADWARKRGYEFEVFHLFEGHFPEKGGSPDCLVVLGGPMSTSDVSACPWLIPEKRLIQLATQSGTAMVGICLGAQLIAEVLGACVSKNERPEIGWFPVQRTTRRRDPLLGTALPEAFGAFHWHGDTFSIPDGARRIARSSACENQGFVYADRVLALQFHLEVTLASAMDLIAHSDTDDVAGGAYVQSPWAMVSDPRRFEKANELLFKVLDRMTGGVSSSESLAGVPSAGAGPRPPAAC